MPQDKEIELKFPVSKKDFFAVKAKLEKIAKFEKTSEQADDYFVPAHRNFLEHEFPFEWLSIRRRGSKAILNYKHFFPENVEIHSHCNEFETEISNAEAMEKVFSELNFKKLVRVEKKRTTFLFNNELEIALDELKDSGFFIEIEAKKDFGGIEETRKKLFEFAEKLGIGNIEPDKRGYPYLVLKKKGLI
ncbi:MAG TPA: class IV adenylate cyclase [archaeon]|nr:class IV adenylate cyclase [archaeon]